MRFSPSIHTVLGHGRYPLLGFVILQTLGCADGIFPSYSELGRLRVLALVADRPEIQNPPPGLTSVQITPYVSDIKNIGDLQLTLQSCLDPGVSLGAQPSCSGSPSASAPQTTTVSGAPTTVEGLFGQPARTGAPQSGPITVPLHIPPDFLSSFSPTAQHNGISYLITATLVSSRETIRAFRRILISNKTPNTNPTITDLLINNTSLIQHPEPGSHKLSFTTNETPETYLFLAGTGAFFDLEEKYEMTWFFTTGEAPSYRSFLNETITWVTTWSPSGNVVPKPLVVGVLRDGRGGVDVKIRVLTP